MTMTLENVETRAITPEDLLSMPDRSGYELFDGKLVERSVSRESSRVGLTIGRLLGNEAARTNDVEVYGCDLGYQCFPDAEKDRFSSDLNSEINS